MCKDNNYKEFKLTNGRKQLMEAVVENSVADNFAQARLEWIIIGCDIFGKKCVCSKEDIKLSYRIMNINNGNILYPIGSSCILKFQSEHLRSGKDIFESYLKIYKHKKACKKIEYTAEFFSKKFIENLYEGGCFTADKFNNYDSKSEYEFMLKYFGKNKAPNDNQKRKINTILNLKIIPFCIKTIINKYKYARK